MTRLLDVAADHEEKARASTRAGQHANAVGFWVLAADAYKRIADTGSFEARAAQLRCIREIGAAADRWADQLEQLVHGPGPTQPGGAA